MPSFGKTSRDRLDTCHERIQELMNDVILDYDCAVLEGFRGELTQNEYYDQGRSKVRWPNGKHNTSPSMAIDVAPWIDGRIPWPVTPKNWNDPNQRNRYVKDLAQFYHFAGYVMSRAAILGIRIRWGGDWDMDHDLRDNKFDDLVHFELISALGV